MQVTQTILLWISCFISWLLRYLSATLQGSPQPRSRRRRRYDIALMLSIGRRIVNCGSSPLPPHIVAVQRNRQSARIKEPYDLSNGMETRSAGSVSSLSISPSATIANLSPLACIMSAELSSPSPRMAREDVAAAAASVSNSDVRSVDVRGLSNINQAVLDPLLQVLSEELPSPGFPGGTIPPLPQQESSSRDPPREANCENSVVSLVPQLIDEFPARLSVTAASRDKQNLHLSIVDAAPRTIQPPPVMDLPAAVALPSLHLIPDSTPMPFVVSVRETKNFPTYAAGLSAKLNSENLPGWATICDEIQRERKWQPNIGATDTMASGCCTFFRLLYSDNPAALRDLPMGVSSLTGLSTCLMCQSLPCLYAALSHHPELRRQAQEEVDLIFSAIFETWTAGAEENARQILADTLATLLCVLPLVSILSTQAATLALAEFLNRFPSIMDLEIGNLSINLASGSCYHPRTHLNNLVVTLAKSISLKLMRSQICVADWQAKVTPLFSAKQGAKDIFLNRLIPGMENLLRRKAKTTKLSADAASFIPRNFA